MKKYMSLLLVSFILLVGGTVVWAIPEKGQGTIPVDGSANVAQQDNSPVIDENWLLTSGINPINIKSREFIHWDKSHAAGVTTQTVSGPCYGTFAKWNILPVSYVINPKNSQGLDAGFITSTLFAAAETWDAATDQELYNDVYTTDTRARYGRLDGKNVFTFGKTRNGVIAVTRTWYNTETGYILDSDILYNQLYPWGNAAIDPSKMDLQNIATHEDGHNVGLVDQYDRNACADVTMYGYSDFGEVTKRTLESPDILGLLSSYP